MLLMTDTHSQSSSEKTLENECVPEAAQFHIFPLHKYNSAFETALNPFWPSHQPVSPRNCKYDNLTSCSGQKRQAWRSEPPIQIRKTEVRPTCWKKTSFEQKCTASPLGSDALPWQCKLFSVHHEIASEHPFSHLIRLGQLGGYGR